MKLQDRESNIELLRLILMLMVVIVHFLGHNILSASDSITTDNPHFYSSNLLQSFVVCAVDCFVLISGWFTIKFNVTKLIMFLVPICLYQFLISCAYYPFGARWNINPFVYWFVPPYVALMVVSPILNNGLKMLQKKSLAAILVCLTLIFIIPLHSFSGMQGKNALIFIYIYSLGYFLKNHFVNKYSSVTYFACYVLMALLIFVETICLGKFGRFEGVKTLSYSYDNALIILESVFFLLIFTKIKIKSALINRLSASAFFVYIITENLNCWKHETHSIYKLMAVSSWEGSAYYILLILAASFGVFVLALVIDLLRRLILFLPMQYLNDKLQGLEKSFLSDKVFSDK